MSALPGSDRFPPPPPSQHDEPIRFLSQGMHTEVLVLNGVLIDLLIDLGRLNDGQLSQKGADHLRRAMALDDILNDRAVGTLWRLKAHEHDWLNYL